jgi:hypothetical protein
MSDENQIAPQRLDAVSSGVPTQFFPRRSILHMLVTFLKHAHRRIRSALGVTTFLSSESIADITVRHAQACRSPVCQCEPRDDPHPWSHLEDREVSLRAAACKHMLAHSRAVRLYCNEPCGSSPTNSSDYRVAMLIMVPASIADSPSSSLIPLLRLLACCRR